MVLVLLGIDFTWTLGWNIGDMREERGLVIDLGAGIQDMSSVGTSSGRTITSKRRGKCRHQMPCGLATTWRVVGLPACAGRSGNGSGPLESRWRAGMILGVDGMVVDGSDRCCERSRGEGGGVEAFGVARQWKMSRCHQECVQYLWGSFAHRPWDVDADDGARNLLGDPSGMYHASEEGRPI